MALRRTRGEKEEEGEEEKKKRKKKRFFLCKGGKCFSRRSVVSFDLCSLARVSALTFLHKSEPMSSSLVSSSSSSVRVLAARQISSSRSTRLPSRLALLAASSSLCQGSSREQPLSSSSSRLSFTLATSPADGLVPPRPDGLQGAFLILFEHG